MDSCYHQPYETKRYETHSVGLPCHGRNTTSPGIGQYRVTPHHHHSPAVTSRHGSAWSEINNLGWPSRTFECGTHCGHHHSTGPDSSPTSIVYGLSSAPSESQPVRNLYDLYTSRSEPPVHECNTGYRFHEPTYYGTSSDDNYYCCNSDPPNTWNEADTYHECNQPSNIFETSSYQSSPMLRSISTHQSTFESSHSASWEEVPGPVRYTHYKVGNCNASSGGSSSGTYPRKECRNVGSNAYQTRSSMSMEMSATTKYKLMAQLSEHITIKEHNFTDIYRFRRHHNVNNCYKSSKTMYSEMKQIQINSIGASQCSSPDSDSVTGKNSIIATNRSGHRTNLCYICGKTYARPSTLKTHLRTHSGEKPYR